MANSAVLEWASPGVQNRLEYMEPKWYAVYTYANHEKRVAQQLQVRSIEHFLPLYEMVHRRKDRRVYLQLPLFPGYVFVRLALREKRQVLEVPSVVYIVHANGRAAALGDEEMSSLRRGLASALGAQPHPYLTAGRPVAILRGPLAGCEGILVRRKGNFRVVLSLNLIMRSFAVEVDIADIRPCLQRSTQAASANC